MTPFTLSLLDHRVPVVAARIHAVQSAAYRQEAGLLGVRHFPPLDRTPEDIAASPDTYLGASHGADLLGVVSIERTGADEVWIASLTVAPAAQRRGAGRALVVAAATQAGSARLWVSTAVRNAPALALYAALGFRAQRQRRVGAEAVEIVELVAAAADIARGLPGPVRKWQHGG